MRAMFDLAAVGIAQADPRTGRWLRVNQKMCAITGYDADELLGMRISELTHPDDRQADSEAFQRVVRGEQPDYRLEKRYVRKDGTVAWVNVNMTVIRDADGQPTRTIATIEDIVERRQAAEALIASEVRYRRLFEAARDGILILDADTGIVLDVNPFLVELLGFTHEQFLGKRIWELGPFKDIFANLDKFLQLQGYVRYDDKPLQCADGRRIAVEFVSNVYQVDHHKVIQCNVRDISARQRADDALRQSEQRYRAVERSAADAIITANGDGAIIGWNPAAQMMFGYTEAEACGQPITSMIPSQYRGRPQQGLEALDCGGKSHAVARTLELMGLRKDGNEFPLELSVATWEGADGRLFSGIIRDITERRRAQEVHDKLQAQLLQAQKMEAVGSLAGGVAHDFNNMLTVVKGCAEMALEKLPPADPVRADVEEILGAADRSAALVRQLLAFARKQTIAPKVLDLNDTIAPMLTMLKQLIGEGVELVWKPGTDLWPVNMDPSQIGQILVNLVINARDAIARVGRVTVETAGARIDEAYCTLRPYFVPGIYVMLMVSDDGCGMDEKTQAQIFEPFFSTKPLGEGTGLGLATVYGIVKQNGGFINVYSEPGHGAMFAIYLPALESEAPIVTAGPRESESAVASSGPKTVLLVEDDAALLALGRRMLERLGYTVLAAGGPIQAIELIKAFPGEIHLLMTDVVMPEMNGRELQRVLAALRPGLKCLFTSGYTSDVIADHGVLDEGIHFLQKPFSRKTLAEKVRDAIG
jgi:PAS domain S-box-containing protein